MKAFITGVTGFAGSYLAEHLTSLGHEVSGTYLSDESLVNVDLVKDRITLYKVDLRDANAVSQFIEKAQPDQIYHLAALPAPSGSFDNPTEYLNNNISVQVNLLEAVRKAGIKPRILVVSSAEVYGAVDPSDLPIDEETTLRPVNPYAVSKVTQDFLGLQYFLAYDLPIIRVRPFNHIGPRQAPTLVVASFAKKVSDIEKGKIEPVLKVGNLSAKRDFTDVHDTVIAYSQIIEKGTLGDVYNIGSGRSIAISEIVDKLLALSSTEIKVEQDPELLRPVDVPELTCDYSKLKNLTGWEPKIPIEQTLEETLEYWRGQN